jgi:tRNA(fMet)-specific endonuclease VapC
MILDTSVIVDIDRGVSDAAVNRLDDDSPHMICSITITEFYTGVFLAESEEGKADGLIENAEEVPVRGEVAKEAARIIAELTEKGSMISMNDVYIAAVARVHDETVLTSDVAHFEKVDGLNVVDWAEYSE